MSKTDIRKVTYTPVFDNLIDEFGLYTAAVFGRVWRYCQMQRGYCHAEQTRIADELGIKRETVNRSLKLLVDAGYLSDATPNTKGRTRIYKDTGKAGTSTLPEALVEVVSEDVSEAVSEVVSDPVSLSHTKKEKKEKKEKTLLPSGEVGFSNSEIQEQEHLAEKNKGSSKELEFLNTANEEQRRAYYLAKQVAGIDRAIEKATSETPMESAISLVEWHAENSTSNARVARVLLAKIEKEESREESIECYEDNLNEVQRTFISKALSVYRDVSHTEMNNLWDEYINFCHPLYDGKDKYDMFAHGKHNREGADDRAHYERIELFFEQHFKSSITA